jgi:hypothetical protein
LGVQTYPPTDYFMRSGQAGGANRTPFASDSPLSSMPIKLHGLQIDGDVGERGHLSWLNAKCIAKFSMPLSADFRRFMYMSILDSTHTPFKRLTHNLNSPPRLLQDLRKTQMRRKSFSFDKMP